MHKRCRFPASQGSLIFCWQIAVKALGIGKHIICGAPGGLGQAECLRVVQAAQYYPALLAGLAYPLRHHPALQAMRDLLADWLGGPASLLDIRINCASLLGQQYSWQCDSGMGGGVLAGLGSHAIDLVRKQQCHRWHCCTICS